MARISVTLCDLCEDFTRSTQHWQLKGPNGTRLLDLCDQHAQPLRDLYDAGTKPQAVGNTRQVGKGPGSRLHVTTMDEINAMKASR